MAEKENKTSIALTESEVLFIHGMICRAKTDKTQQQAELINKLDRALDRMHPLFTV